MWTVDERRKPTNDRMGDLHRRFFCSIFKAEMIPRRYTWWKYDCMSHERSIFERERAKPSHISSSMNIIVTRQYSLLVARHDTVHCLQGPK